MWKYLNENVIGTSHALTGIECQDSSFLSSYEKDGQSVLLLACSDGAGSASQSRIGSSVASKSFVNCVVSYFEGGGAVEGVTQELFHGWIKAVREAVIKEATDRNLPEREFACTLLVGVVGETFAVFGQLGDGAIVRGNGKEYFPIFWPQNGEYQNTTFFLTDPQFDEHVQVKVVQENISEVAIFTDGLQMLALNYAEKGAHNPFFIPLFKTLRESTAEDLIVPFRQFLDSKAVNDRTDDDKTLILATRLQVDVEPIN